MSLARSVKLEVRVKGKSRRAMTAALAIRFTLLMTAMPDADYPEVIAALLGDLAAVPWHRRYRLPTATVATTWRDALGPGPLEKLRDMLLAAIGAEHDDHDYRAVQVGDLDVCSIDGSLTRVPDTPANRQAYGSAGTADDSSPYPQLRELRLSNASTRAALAVTCGPSGAAAGGEREKGEAEQKLLDKALDSAPHLFTSGRIWIMDRNFRGSSPDPADARDRHARADPRQGWHHAGPGRRVPARWLLPGAAVRRRRHPHRPRDRVPRHRRRARRPRAVLPDH